MTTSSTQNLNACETCHGAQFSRICERQDGLTVWLCQNCGLQFINPIPDVAFLQELYERESKRGDSGIPYYQNYIRERQIRIQSYRRQYEKRLKLIEKLHPQKGKLLEIGCAGGFFLKTAKDQGWDPYGIDIDSNFVKFANDDMNLANVHCNTLENIRFENNFFDAVILWDLIEHLPHPMQSIKTLHSLLKKNGVLVIWTPNVKNAAFLKNKWYGYHISQHLYFFSTDSLKKMMAQAGFETVYQNTNKTKKAFLTAPGNNSFKAQNEPSSRAQKILRGLKRDIKNALNPINSLSPLFDRMGYGFNLYMIFQKKSDPVER